jgi:hypothetical protein
LRRSVKDILPMTIWGRPEKEPLGSENS